MENTQNYAKRIVEGVDEKSNDIDKCQLILDGQQRTTTAYQILYDRGEFVFYFNLKQFIEDLKQFIEDLKAKNIKEQNDKDLESLIEDNLEDLIAVFERKQSKKPKTTADEISKGLFPLQIILNESQGLTYTKWLMDYSFNYAKGNQQIDIIMYNFCG